VQFLRFQKTQNHRFFDFENVPKTQNRRFFDYENFQIKGYNNSKEVTNNSIRCFGCRLSLCKTELLGAIVTCSSSQVGL
jgi:hypothetical protein